MILQGKGLYGKPKTPTYTRYPISSNKPDVKMTHAISLRVLGRRCQTERNPSLRSCCTFLRSEIRMLLFITRIMLTATKVVPAILIKEIPGGKKAAIPGPKANSNIASEYPIHFRLLRVLGRRYQTDDTPSRHSRRILVRMRISEILATISTGKPTITRQVMSGNIEKKLCMVGESPLTQYKLFPDFV